jgi:hypothetical protein
MPNKRDFMSTLKKAIIVLAVEIIGIFILWYLVTNSLISNFYFFTGIISLFLIVFVAEVSVGVSKHRKKINTTLPD